MAQIQSLHLCIDHRILLIPISILPVQIFFFFFFFAPCHCRWPLSRGSNQLVPHVPHSEDAVSSLELSRGRQEESSLMPPVGCWTQDAQDPRSWHTVALSTSTQAVWDSGEGESPATTH